MRVYDVTSCVKFGDSTNSMLNKLYHRFICFFIFTLWMSKRGGFIKSINKLHEMFNSFSPDSG